MPRQPDWGDTRSGDRQENPENFSYWLVVLFWALRGEIQPGYYFGVRSMTTGPSTDLHYTEPISMETGSIQAGRGRP